MKTLGEWRTSGARFHDYVAVGERVSDDVHDYFLELLPPVVMSGYMLQVGEPYSHVHGKPTFMTFVRDGRGWTYVGHCFAGERHEPK
jgi:hypothetical protein